MKDTILIMLIVLAVSNLHGGDDCYGEISEQSKRRGLFDAIGVSSVIVLGKETKGTSLSLDANATTTLSSVIEFQVDEVLHGSLATNSVYLVWPGRPSRNDAILVSGHSYLLFLNELSPRARHYYIDSAHYAKSFGFVNDKPAFWVMGGQVNCFDLEQREPGCEEYIKALLLALKTEDPKRKLLLYDKIGKECKDKWIAGSASGQAESLRKNPRHEEEMRKMQEFREQYKKTRIDKTASGVVTNSSAVKQDNLTE